MKIELTTDYQLIITPENAVEELALRAWNENADKTLLIKAYDDGDERAIRYNTAE